MSELSDIETAGGNLSYHYVPLYRSLGIRAVSDGNSGMNDRAANQESEIHSTNDITDTPDTALVATDHPRAETLFSVAAAEKSVTPESTVSSRFRAFAEQRQFDIDALTAADHPAAAELMRSFLRQDAEAYLRRRAAKRQAATLEAGQGATPEMGQEASSQTEDAAKTNDPDFLTVHLLPEARVKHQLAVFYQNHSRFAGDETLTKAREDALRRSSAHATSKIETSIEFIGLGKLHDYFAIDGNMEAFEVTRELLAAYGEAIQQDSIVNRQRTRERRAAEWQKGMAQERRFRQWENDT